jgi:hypothetical protein
MFGRDNLCDRKLEMYMEPKKTSWKQGSVILIHIQLLFETAAAARDDSTILGSSDEQNVKRLPYSQHSERHAQSA